MDSLAGVTLISNGVKLGYPFEICIQNMLNCCDEVFVVTDKENKDDTLDILYEMRKETSRLKLIVTTWDWDNHREGKELARLANLGIAAARIGAATHLLYLQADEIIIPEQVRASYPVDGNWAIERTYFWQDLSHINLSWTMSLPRLCLLTPNLKVIEDGMSMEVSQRHPLYAMPPEVLRIFHYSRVGDTEKIAARLNSIDSLFHEEYVPLLDYQFGINNNFENGVLETTIIEYNGIHPKGIKEFYNE